MLLQIEHRLHFRYSGFIRESHMDIRVEPRTQSEQILLEFSLVVGPTTRVTRHEDWLGNATHWFSITDYHERIEVFARSLVETTPKVVLPGLIEDPIMDKPPSMDLWDFLQIAEPIIDDSALRSLHADMGLTKVRTVGEAVEIVGKGLPERFEYRPHVTDAHSTTDALLAGGCGVCQDFAHAALGLLRMTGIPARYVSGYLHIEREEETPS
ncbi:MAG: transglutaminase family protein, partial [Planctomycetota bacterium]|nr:transglutaminase family protein [Planctomycetota bacterium]